MTASFTKGRFVWNDLMTRDVGRARAFYTELMGWSVNEVDMGPHGKYPMLMNKGEGVGGIELLKGVPESVPSHWGQYVSVEDVDAALKIATANGGSIVVPAFDIPGVGRTAFVQDPGGAVIAPFRGSQGEMKPEHERPPVGDFCWYEVLTTKVAETKAFYTALFGWTWEQMPVPGMEYFVAKSGDKQRAGLMAKPAEAPMSAWLAYLNVGKLAEATKRAESLGAKKLMGPHSMPGVGTWNVIADPTGAVVALFEGS
jgi:predicted enzyme related to lactoylglutathione lyase